MPQFVNRDEPVSPRFLLLLGVITVRPNTSVDVIVALLTGRIGATPRQRSRLRRVKRCATGGALLALGACVAATG